jgi:hypothetical protein
VGAIARFEQAFLALCEQRPLCRSLTFTEAGLVLGAGTSVAPMRRDGEGAKNLDLSGEDRILALLTVAFSAPVKAAVLVKLQHASALWARGDKSLAQIYLEHLRLPKLETEEQAFRLFLADHLIASGPSPRGLCKDLGFDLPKGLRKFDSDQPRDDHGRWTSGGAGGDAGSAGGSPAAGSSRSNTDAPSSTVPSRAEQAAAGAAAEGTILGSLSAESLAGLATVAAGFAGAAAAFGLVFIPSPNGGVTSQGAVPGEPGLNYSLNHEEGSLRITRTGPAGDETVTAAHLGQDGVFRDETGAPIARAAGSSVVIDPDAVRATASEREKQQDEAGARVSAEAQTETKREEPKLCPDPGPENINGRKKFDVQYEQYVRSIVNPQRQPPLPAGLAFSLTNPATGEPVRYDDCRESDGPMIEAKGHYEVARQNRIISDSIDDKWVEQATRQVDASGGRDIEWYFHEQAAADAASKLFEDDDKLKRIKIFVRPYPGGVPKHNPRINSLDEYEDFE